MNISSLNFEVLEVSNKDERGQSTGIVITFPNSIVFTKAIKNINKGFKYVWDELTVNIKMDCDLVKNKQELYKIVNGLEVVKNIPKKMKEEVDIVNQTNRVYFNKYDPIIYTKLVGDHIELTIRYLMHPKKSRYVESVIWNKIYLSYKEGIIDLYTGLSED
jgi:small-conductance mechanosensitive channel